MADPDGSTLLAPSLVARFGDTLRPLLVHSTLVGLTPLVPVPFLDDALKQRLQRRLVRDLADAWRVALTESDVRELADDPSHRWLDGVARSAALMPVKLVLRKTFVVLTGTRVVDVASDCFHRGYLLDRTFRQRWCAPAGANSPRAVRAAIDEICREVPTKPLAHAFRTAFEQSKTALGRASDALNGRTSSRNGETKGAVATDDLGGSPAVLDVVKRLQVALASAPDDHFRALDERLAAKLSQ